MMPYHALKCPMLLNALLACGVKHLTLEEQPNDDKALFYYDTATTQLLRSLQNPDRHTAECAATAVVLSVYEIMNLDHWGLDMGFLSSPSLGNNNSNGAECDDDGVGADVGNEEVWVHRIFYIAAKIANFRASIPKSQKPRAHDERICLQTRYAEWQRLRNMCDSWNNAVPCPMHSFGYRAAIVGHLYYHMAQCLLAQVNPVSPQDTADMRTAQLHHAHQVCGIVAHTEDRGVASVLIRSLAIVAEVLTDLCERQEVFAILENVDRETGWRLAGVLSNLKRVWGWENVGQIGWRRSSRRAPAVATTPPTKAQPQQQSRMPMMQAQKQPAAVTASRPMRINPLSFADFSLPNHPYQNWYEPPSQSNSYNSQGFL
ncbi:hypothetical protein DL764_004161 [Monosporascus ibericus]|uniref:Transcription factor domain-containing protein n=1 Tax=Monosporascus ibericus TaxID=155417 RepID=A0A4Q4TDR8_9PEZI|nr:hypothetical protein DL764_004161 [Monosporascus ibericus]